MPVLWSSRRVKKGVKGGRGGCGSWVGEGEASSSSFTWLLSFEGSSSAEKGEGRSGFLAEVGSLSDVHGEGEGLDMDMVGRLLVNR